MADAIFNVPPPHNEPNLTYAPGTPERKALKDELARLGSMEIEIPAIIGGREARTGRLGECRPPHDHGRVIGRFHRCGEKEAGEAIRAAIAAKEGWAALPWEERASVFLKAAEMLAGPWRQTLNAATMLGQSKTVIQAELDSACELADFWRFNVHYMRKIYEDQPLSMPGVWNRVEHRPLEGFVFAVTPFNFTAIGGNLPTAPAIAGNVVVWKPASTAVYPAWFVMKLLEAAGLPPGVINMAPGSGSEVGNPVLASRDLAGVHFTGSTQVFQGIWKTIGENIGRYRTYPRIVGETGGKDFLFAHPSADLQTLLAALVRGAFEYQGQKCSAVSRAYFPKSLWPEIRERLGAIIPRIKVGDPADFSNFMGAVIDRASFERIRGFIDQAGSAGDASVILGGECDASSGYFIRPTVIETADPRYRTMEEEIFGPVLTVFPYDDGRLEETLELCDRTSPYGLTGAIFSRDRLAIERMSGRLRNAAGNFYINDKPTGGVVGQQPFGGARASGTNDKAGGMLNMQRWISQRTIKENFVPPVSFEYPCMKEK